MSYVTLGYYLDQPFGDVIDVRKIGNLLPFEVDIVCGKFQHKLKAFSSVSVKGDAFNAGDTMYVYYLGKLVTQGLIPRRSTHIRIGDVVGASVERVFYGMKGDIQHLMFHNLLPMPVSIYYQGNKIGIVGGRDGKGYFGGSYSVLDLNNETEGFYLGDVITLKICGLKPNPKEETDWLKFELVDSMTTDLYLGKVNTQFTPPPSDTYAYRFDEPQMGWTGITYYSNAGQKDPYRTYPTNPNAPF